MHEVLDADPTFDLATAWIDTNRACGHVVVTDDQDVGNLLDFCRSNALSELIVGGHLVHTEASRKKPLDDRVGIRLVGRGHRKHANLHWCQPRRKCSCVVLEQHSEEALD